MSFYNFSCFLLPRPPQFFPNGNAIITGSDDCSCKMYDLRSDQEVSNYQDTSLNAGVTSLALSNSGRLIFAGYDDFNCHIWDSLKGEKVGECGGKDLQKRTSKPLFFLFIKLQTINKEGRHPAGTKTTRRTCSKTADFSDVIIHVAHPKCWMKRSLKQKKHHQDHLQCFKKRRFCCT